MNAFEQLLKLPAAGKKKQGLEFTPPEIAQQPAVWRKAVKILKDQQQAIASFMTSSGLRGKEKATLVLSGAGTSEFVGNAVSYGLRQLLAREILSIPTTHFVTHASQTLVPEHKYVVLSFARSGDSPESVATYRFIKGFYTQAKQMVITCNRNGALAKAASSDQNSFCICLPEETNDRSLVMTSSFSTMALTALGLPFINDLDTFEELVDRLATAGNRVISEYGDLLQVVGTKPFTRACFLGSNTLFGTMQECHLKMQEMTEGRVACRFESFLGLRHGPQVFVNPDCMVFAALSSDSYARKYEMDMLTQLRNAGQGCGLVVVCDKKTGAIAKLTEHVIELFPAVEPVPDVYRVMTDVVVGQIFAMFKCISLGLKPDNPSTTGTINRVVKGVVIYDA
jgi:tagatose-6-phosphate ketose/aldose isomerase